MQSRQTSSQPENTIVSYDSLDFVSGSAHNITMYSVKEAAEKLKISEQHLRYLLAKGEIEGRKISRDWVVLTLDYKRKRKPKRRIKAEPVVVMDAKTDSIVKEEETKEEKTGQGPKFELHQLVKVIVQDTPYRNQSGRVREIIKQQLNYLYWIEFSWPPQGYSNMKDFMEEHLVSTEDFFLMRGTTQG